MSCSDQDFQVSSVVRYCLISPWQSDTAMDSCPRARSPGYLAASAILVSASAIIALDAGVGLVRTRECRLLGPE